MEAKATLKYANIAPRKVMIVLDLIRGKQIDEAAAILKYTPNKAANIVGKLLNSAAANAENNFSMDSDKLFVSRAYADQGPTLKRFLPRAHGRADVIRKRSSHITLVLEEK